MLQKEMCLAINGIPTEKEVMLLATTGSSLEALSAFMAFISSYPVLMRGIRPAMKSKASTFYLAAMY